MEIDLHGFELREAIDEISYCLDVCQAKGIQDISIIHGYHGKQVLKDYIESEGFLKEMAREGFKLNRKSSSNPGISHFSLNKI